MDPTRIESILSLYRVDSNNCRSAYVLDGAPPRQTDVWFRHCEHKGKEFVVLRFGTKEIRVFIPVTNGKQLQEYLGEPED